MESAEQALQYHRQRDPTLHHPDTTVPMRSTDSLMMVEAFTPAISWPARGRDSRPDDPDVYDFRMSDWFVGGATCPKDLAILVDSTSFHPKNSQTGCNHDKSILDTLSTNDYVNVYRFAESVEETVQCFKDSLVQASPENVRSLKNSLYSIQSDSTANVSAAMATGFEILYKYNRTLERGLSAIKLLCWLLLILRLRLIEAL
ncbi:hypothetical protein KQX54_000896 [Cotesia glomerata]|uniref:VWFA domain-containing protein n=1 Tax=Cotesia glomerata TaxID=32391 RepID=A0AAV7I3F1_COTGL|nr:hypothetical protein KQX54_000896 [Cotesia glomerata]